MTTQKNSVSKKKDTAQDQLVTEEDILIRELADILFEACVWEHEHKGKESELYVSNRKKKTQKNPSTGFPEDQEFHL